MDVILEMCKHDKKKHQSNTLMSLIDDKLLWLGREEKFKFTT